MSKGQEFARIFLSSTTPVPSPSPAHTPEPSPSPAHTPSTSTRNNNISDDLEDDLALTPLELKNDEMNRKTKLAKFGLGKGLEINPVITMQQKKIN